MIDSSLDQKISTGSGKIVVVNIDSDRFIWVDGSKTTYKLGLEPNEIYDGNFLISTLTLQEFIFNNY